MKEQRFEKVVEYEETGINFLWVISIASLAGMWMMYKMPSIIGGLAITILVVLCLIVETLDCRKVFWRKIK